MLLDLLQSLGEGGVDMLLDLLQKIFEQEKMPEEWRDSVIVPIFKAKIKKISSDTHPLTKLHHFKLERFKSI